jgi:hypothetical protein
VAQYGDPCGSLAERMLLRIITNDGFVPENSCRVESRLIINGDDLTHRSVIISVMV